VLGPRALHALHDLLLRHCSALMTVSASADDVTLLMLAGISRSFLSQSICVNKIAVEVKMLHELIIVKLNAENVTDKTFLS